MGRRGATQSAGRRPGASHEQSRRRAGLRIALYLTLLLNLAVAAVMLYVHVQLEAARGAGGIYRSFCDVNEQVSCDAVLTSRWGSLLGYPLAGWAFASYVALAAMVAWQGSRVGGSARTQATLLLLGAALWAAFFALYMAAIAALVIGKLCPLCAAMYVLNVLFAVLAWRLARGELGGAPLVTLRRAGLVTAGTMVSLAVIGGAQFSAFSAADPPRGADDVCRREPQFCAWYRGLALVDALPASDHAKGPPDAPLMIVEFSDFECTFCAKAFRDLRDLERQHPGTIHLVFHHFPLDSQCNPHVQVRMHPNACLAAIAAECAARDERFWEYHDTLFGAQDRLGREDLIGYATALGIDRARFTACLDDPEIAARVREDVDAGGRLAVKSTPTLFINGRTVEGALERDAYEYVLAMERRG